MGKIRIFILILIVPGLAACGKFMSSSVELSSEAGLEQPPSPEPETEPENPPPPAIPPEEKITPARWESKRTDSRPWTLHAFKELEIHGLDLLAQTPKDVANFCTNYAKLDRTGKKNFWVYLISSLAQFESGFDPKTSYTEDFADANGVKVVSRGLLQLSIESAKGYDCPVVNANELHDPLKNLTCTIRIFNRWVGQDGVIRGGGTSGWKGGARYWSVLRRDAQFASIRSYTQSQTYCQ